VQEAKVAIVTGSSRGIGLEIARALGRTGHAVMLIARDQGALDQAKAQLTNEGIRAATFAADLRDPTAAVRAMQATVAGWQGRG